MLCGRVGGLVFIVYLLILHFVGEFGTQFLRGLVFPVYSLILRFVGEFGPRFLRLVGELVSDAIFLSCGRASGLISFVYLPILCFVDEMALFGDAEIIEPIEVDAEGERGSPTELAESSGDDQEMKAKNEKRKRDDRGRDARSRDVRAFPVPGGDDEDELESPSKRAQRAEEPFTAREMRELLMGHVREMKSAWTTFQGRLDHLEGVQEKQGSAIDKHDEMMSQLRTRTKVIEKDMASQKKAQQQTVSNLDALTEEVKNMKVQWDDMRGKVEQGEIKRPAALNVPVDPWAAFLQRRGQEQVVAEPAGAPPHLASGSGPVADKGDSLTEEEKRTLVIGGWLRDTRRSVIEEESQQVLCLDAVKQLLDVDKLMIYGPRRSVGMLRFSLREGEGPGELRTRMWETVKIISNLKHALPSTKEGEEHRTMWASFVKTKNARAKSALVSMVRRVTIALALDAKDENGSVPCVGNTQITAYDCDWALGTIWCGALKLASATHKQPREGEHVLMSGGWVSLTSVATSAGCTIEEAKLAFEREL